MLLLLIAGMKRWTAITAFYRITSPRFSVNTSSPRLFLSFSTLRSYTSWQVQNNSIRGLMISIYSKLLCASLTFDWLLNLGFCKNYLHTFEEAPPVPSIREIRVSSLFVGCHSDWKRLCHTTYARSSPPSPTDPHKSLDCELNIRIHKYYRQTAVSYDMTIG